MEKQSLINTRDLSNVPALAPAAAFSRPEYSAEPQSGSLLDYWHTISRRKLSLLIFSLAGLGIGIGVTLTQAPMYRASSSMEIQEVKDDTLGAKIFNPQQSEGAPVDSLTDIQTQIKILQSRTLIERALDKAGISSVADLKQGSGAILPWLQLSHASASGNTHDALLEKVTKSLKVDAVPQTRIVEVSYTATDPVLAAGFTNALTSEFIDQNLQTRFQMDRKTSGWLIAQVDEMRGKLRESEDALQAYARANGLIYTADKQMLSEEKLRELQTELSQAQADRVDKQSKVEVAHGATAESVPEVLSDNNIRLMENNLIDLRKQEAEMSVTFKPDYTKAKMLHAEIVSLASAVEAKRAVIVSRLENELQESERREQLLSGAYVKQTRFVTGDSQKSIQYDMLKHDVDTNREIYQVMLQRVKESSIASALKSSNLRVIDPAKAPEHPDTPKMPLNAGVGLLGGLMLGVLSAVVRSKADGTVQEPGDVGMLLGIPELGVIPAAAPGRQRGTSLATLFSGQKDYPSLSLNATPASQLSPMIADSFRAVLASILFAGAKDHQRVLVITSASPQEGKSTTSSNLAATLANMGRKVLLIDGDIRSPHIHEIFGLGNSTGLTTVLTQIGINSALTENFIQETSVSNLHVLTAGPAVRAGADLLFSTSMPALIARCRNEYDMVLIDTAPMLVMPDARVLGRAADAVVLIARAGKTTRSAIQAAYRRFVEDRTPVLGVVLNDWNSKLSAYKYYSAYEEKVTEQALVKIPAAGA